MQISHPTLGSPHAMVTSNAELVVTGSILIPGTTNINDISNVNKSYFNHFLKSGTSTEAIGNYSAGASATFEYIAPVGSKIEITRLISTITDTNIKNAGGYGGLLQLSSGIDLYVVQSGTALELTNDFTIKTNADWGAYCHDVSLHDFGVGSNFITSRWTFAAGETNLKLNGSPDRFYALLNDDFTGLIDHRFQIQGFYK